MTAVIQNPLQFAATGFDQIVFGLFALVTFI